jgi:uncharacterized membrane protein YccF (DUF307 family)
MLGLAIFGDWFGLKHIIAYVVILIIIIGIVWFVARGRART